MAKGAAYSMHTAAVPFSPIALAAAMLRSMSMRRVEGPRSLTTTMTDLPVFGFVTVRRVPNGNVRWAAVMLWGSNRSPLEVVR